MKATNKQTKAAIIARITAADVVAGEYEAQALNTMTKAQLKVVEASQRTDEGSDVEHTNGSKVKQEYRARYAVIAAGRDRKPTTAAGRGTLNNGDKIAIAFEVLNHEQVCVIADKLCPLDGTTHAAKYAHLNTGMQRMNSGNRIRSAVKRGDVAEGKVIAAAKAA